MPAVDCEKLLNILKSVRRDSEQMMNGAPRGSGIQLSRRLKMPEWKSRKFRGKEIK